MFSEAQLRDDISNKLFLIEDGLELVKNEFYLKNDYGTNAFIDILAKDKNNNLVIIEVKKSKSSEREAITELFKYITLLKNEFLLNNREIRLIVISTDWRELTLPFSEFIKNTDFNSIGLKAIVNSKGEVISFEKIDLIENKFRRKLSRRHWVQLYGKFKVRNEKSKEFANTLKRIGLKNFIILHFSYEHPYQKNKIEYGFYYAQQEETLSFYENIIKRNSFERYEELSEYTKEFVKSDKLDEYADAIKDFTHVSSDGSEIAHPEKFKGYYEQNKWYIEKIVRYGKLDNKYLTDENIIYELCGYFGTSFNWYFNFANNKDKSAMKEIEENYSFCLYYNEFWEYSIGKILKYLEYKDNKCVFSIHIFNTENILQSIAYSILKKSFNFLPTFNIVIDNNDYIEIFEGSIKVSVNKDINISEVVEEIFEGDESTYLFMCHFGEEKQVNAKLLNMLGLEYSCSYSRINKDEKIFYESVNIRDENISEKSHKTYICNLKEYIESNKKLRDLALFMHKGHSDFYEFKS
ncbi:endonuclease NucS domain-containing protein [Aliarcobacter butzleri]